MYTAKNIIFYLTKYVLENVQNLHCPMAVH
jgi:hypothetical protein